MCSGRCLTGWSGPHCDTPADSETKNINKNEAKDYTKDGLYKPTSDGHSISHDTTHEPSVHKAKKIEDQTEESE